MLFLAPVLFAAAAIARAPGTQACLRALVPVAAESIPQTKDFVPVACPKAGVAIAFRHDPSADSTRLTCDLAPGEVVERFPEYGTPRVLPGQKLSLVVTRGAVQVSRTVTALQAAQSGQRLFVRCDDGQIISVEFEAPAP
jgi:hypothetical protein